MAGSHDQLPCEAEILLAHDPAEIRRAERGLLEAVSRAGYSESSAFAIRLALEEAIYNAFRHGHRDLPDEKVRVWWRVGADEVRVEVRDSGPGFDPGSVPDPTTGERLELPHGRGLMLMKAYMTDVRYNKKGNAVTMTYRRPDRP
jgi:serine/threonine-protein kinase RsbW